MGVRVCENPDGRVRFMGQKNETTTGKTRHPSRPVPVPNEMLQHSALNECNGLGQRLLAHIEPVPKHVRFGMVWSGRRRSSSSSSKTIPAASDTDFGLHLHLFTTHPYTRVGWDGGSRNACTCTIRWFFHPKNAQTPYALCVCVSELSRLCLSVDRCKLIYFTQMNPKREEFACKFRYCNPFSASEGNLFSSCRRRSDRLLFTQHGGIRCKVVNSVLCSRGTEPMGSFNGSFMDLFSSFD